MVVFLIVNLINVLFSMNTNKTKVEILLPLSHRNPKDYFFETDKINKNGYLVLETEIDKKIYKTIKPIKIFEGKVMSYDYYLIRPDLEIYPSKEDYISKEEYEKNPEKYKEQDIFLGRLPVGTIFELLEVKLDSGHMRPNYYYIKILNIPEYKDKLVNAVCISYMAIDGVWVGKWWFVDKEKRLIKTKKLPLINKNYAKELTKKEYKEYYKS